jgi:hypothetical protein
MITPFSYQNLSRKQKEKTRTCNCKKTKCLKLYCECFSLGEICGPSCNCVSCDNKEENGHLRKEAMDMIMVRDPMAFSSKLKAVENNSSVSHARGCNCKKSNCLKKYCECYCAGVKCGESCKCDDCKNGCDHEKPSKGGDEPEEEKALSTIVLEAKEGGFSTEEKVITLVHSNEESTNATSKFIEVDTQPAKSSFKKSTPNRIKLYRGGGGHIQKKNQQNLKRERDDSSSDDQSSPDPMKKLKGVKPFGENSREDNCTEKKIKQELTISKNFDGKMTPYLRGNDVKKNLFDEFKTPVTKGDSERPQRTTRRNTISSYAKTTRKGR